MSDKPAFVRNRPRLSDNGTPGSDVGQLRELYEGRLESLLAVDDLVETVVQRLDDEGVLDSTLVVFSSDNGYMMGNHRLEGKIKLYEESIRVPLLMSGGSFVGGIEREVLVSNLDLAPTFLSLLGVAPGRVVDGVDLSDVVDGPEQFANRALIIESVIGPGYDAVRTTDWIYAEYLGSGIELYDMVRDRDQLESLHGAPEYSDRQSALASLLGDLRDCRGDACVVNADGNPLGSPPPGTTSTTSTSTTLPTTTTTSTPTTNPLPSTEPPVLRLDGRAGSRGLVGASRFGNQRPG